MQRKVRILLHCVSVAIFTRAVLNIIQVLMNIQVTEETERVNSGYPSQPCVKSDMRRTRTSSKVIDMTKLMRHPIAQAVGLGFSHRGAEPPRYGEPSVGLVGRAIPQSQIRRRHFS
jgi:hypothetical protein